MGREEEGKVKIVRRFGLRDPDNKSIAAMAAFPPPLSVAYVDGPASTNSIFAAVSNYEDGRLLVRCRITFICTERVCHG